MISFDEFKDALLAHVSDYLPERLKDWSVSFVQVPKNNVVKDALKFSSPGKDAPSPVMYLDSMYNRFSETNDFEKILETIRAELETVVDKGIVLNNKIDKDSAKDNIVFTLINTEHNKDFLAGVPHRNIEDLSVVYRWVVNIDQDGVASTIVNNNVAKELGLDEETLFDLAQNNTKRIFPPTVLSMNECLKKMMLAEGFPAEMVDEFVPPDLPAEETMWVIGNENQFFGASSILYDNILSDLSDKLDSDLYVLPSSTMEVICVSSKCDAAKVGPNNLSNLVESVNSNQVNVADRLSNNVYFYNHLNCTLTQVTASEKSLSDEPTYSDPVVNFGKKKI